MRLARLRRRFNYVPPSVPRGTSALNNEASFQVYGTVTQAPEPGPLLLWVLGCCRAPPCTGADRKDLLLTVHVRGAVRTGSACSPRHAACTQVGTPSRPLAVEQARARFERCPFDGSRFHDATTQSRPPASTFCLELFLAQVGVGAIEIELQLLVDPIVQQPVVAQSH